LIIRPWFDAGFIRALEFANRARTENKSKNIKKS